MRTTTYLGLILGVVVIGLAVKAKGGDASLFTNTVALLIALGGTIAATTLSSSRMTAVHAMSAMRRMFVSGAHNSGAIASEMIRLARLAKAEGLPAIDPETVPVKVPFLVKGLRLVAD